MTGQIQEEKKKEEEMEEEEEGRGKRLQIDSNKMCTINFIKLMTHQNFTMINQVN